jgi:hypothetical protein
MRWLYVAPLLTSVIVATVIIMACDALNNLVLAVACRIFNCEEDL